MADNPRLTVLCVYPDMSSPPSEVSFSLSPSYGIHTAREAHAWFLQMMQSNEEFEVETDEPGEWPVPFCSETVRRVVVVEGPKAPNAARTLGGHRQHVSPLTNQHRAWGWI